MRLFGPSFEERMKLCDAGPDLIELMDYLKMKKKQKTRFLRLFQSVDKDNSGQISLPEFFTHLKLDHSKFVERSFRQMDINTEGDSNMNLDVCEFFIGLFNFCFLPQTYLSRYLFDLYDDDKDGGITKKELEIMIGDVCGGDVTPLVEKLMVMLDGDQSLDVSFTEFIKVEKKAGTVLKPAFRLQRQLQERCMGSRYGGRRSDSEEQRKLKFKARALPLAMHSVVARPKQHPQRQPRANIPIGHASRYSQALRRVANALYFV